jgi:hypothetical protein
LRTQLRRQSDQQSELTERIEVVSQENAIWAKQNSELQAKVFELEASAAETERVEAALLVAQAALREMSEDLAEARGSAKVDAEVQSPVQALTMSPVQPDEKLEPIPAAPVEVRVEPAKISDRITPAILAKRDVSDPTGEEFDKIRRTIVEKKGLQKPKTRLERFLLPFRDTRIS